MPQKKILKILKMNHASTIELNRPQQPTYNITESYIEFIYKCIATTIYIIVVYMVYYHYNLLIQLLTFVFITIFVLYHIINIFKILNIIFN